MDPGASPPLRIGPARTGVPFSALSASRVAIVDADADAASALERLLVEQGYQSVAVLAAGPEVAEQLAGAPPELLVLALQGDGREGLAILDRLAGLMTGPTPLPVIAVVEELHDPYDVRRQVLAAGARDVLTKPWDPWDALQAVANQLETRYLHRRLHERTSLLVDGDQQRQADLARIAADLAHEVRTPLYSIRGLAEVLLHIEDDLPETLRADVQRIDDVAEEALELIGRQIEAARTAAGRTQVEVGPVHVEALFAGLRAMVEPLAQAKSLPLVFEDPGALRLRTDGGLLAQVLRNLLANAIRHTFSGEVRVSAQLVDAGRKVGFAVADTGVGIHPADRQRIFGSFERVDGSQERTAGGLGLPFARSTARLLGGGVTVVSEPGEGSTFTAVVLRDLADSGEAPGEPSGQLGP